MPTYDDHATGASLTTSGAEGTVMPDGETSYEHRLQCCTAGVLIDEGPLQCSEAAEDEHDTPATVGFLDWTTFDEATLPPRVNARRSRLDRVLSPLKLVKADLPRNVGVEGLGNVIESAHGLFHSVRRLDFMESERTIYLRRDRGSPSPTSLPRRELEIYENELFDMSKYDCSCDYFTALGWTEESLSGCITLYRVLFGNMGEAVAIRPVASMRDVPSPVLVKMRTDARIKRKAVLTPTKEDDRIFEWRANPSRRPRYVGLDNGRGRRAASPLRSPSHSRAKQSGSSLADGDGICATIPQFFALLHAHRSILEYVQSSSIGLSNLEHDGAKPAVFLTHPPRSNPHEGAGVHVAILVPNDVLWAEEEIVWTDPTGLAEFRQRQYRQLIERASARGRSRARNRRSRGYSRDRSRSQT